MPIYEYECSICDFHFERRQRFDEEPVSSCPRCEGKARRVLHSVPVFFKGSGFYSTDNRRGHSGTSKEKEQEPAQKEPAQKEPAAKDGQDTAPKDKK